MIALVSNVSPPTLAEFLAAPAEQIAAVAPKSMVVAPGGTRRAAAMAGIDTNSDTYVRWSFDCMISQFEMMFRHGVQHLFTGAITPNQWSEVGSYRHKLVGWVVESLMGEESLAAYNRHGWRVRLAGWQAIPELEEAAAKLEERTARSGSHTLWFWAIPSYESIWELLLEAAHRTGARTREQLIRAVYGEDVPLISLYLGFAKPEVSPAHLPPLLAGQVQCYWTVRPGYTLDEAGFRGILHDYAHLRPTWRADKSGRAENAIAYKDAWMRGPTLGLGMRLGEDFWYPASIPPPPHSEREKT
ncbi:hypothetical protein JRI60_35475 [Archangium violaceum]|uniref:hypothetical protein n=1 Tax=Archangium violaceum TaxID=83451 RepID=UPI00194FBB20|nr:hypothetical protein [Archangium violaceum]QRN94406.1 hypothetical protein JRI60_35475 [Archangium violaceum]